MSEAKRAAATVALTLVQDGMALGLGSGSTAEIFVELLGAHVAAEKLSLRCVSTSSKTTKIAKDAKLPLVSLEEVRWLDLTIDGADEVTPDLDLIKGGGGALLREKIIASASDRLVIIADESKAVESLGAFLLPVEITPFGWTTTKALLEGVAGAHLDREISGMRREVAGVPFQTDAGNYIIDLKLDLINDPPSLALAFCAVPGVVESGLFIGLADAAIFANDAGETRLIEFGADGDD